MTVRARRIFAAAVLLTAFLTASAFGVCPRGDLTSDCEVGLEDLAVFAEQWLDANCVGSDCADMDGVEGVNMFDFAHLTETWGEVGIPLVINEVMASNVRFIPDPTGEYADWIELYNGGDEPIDVGGMYMTDDSGNPKQWRIPDNVPNLTTIPGPGYLWIWADEDVLEYGLHTNFELDAQGDELRLYDIDGTTLIDSMSFGEQDPDISYGRYPDGSENWRYLGLPSPKMQNSGAFLGEVAEPKFSLQGGFYSYNPRFDPPYYVTIATETEGATIWYTLDGSEPYDLSGRYPTGAVYSGPVPFVKTGCLRAKAIKSGWKPSSTRTATYFLNASWAQRSLPAISLVGDPGKTFYGPDGIMVYPTYRGMEYERPVSCEWIYPADNSGFQIDCGIRVHGSDWMRPRYNYCPGPGVWLGDCKYSFRLYFRGMYGKSRLQEPIFPFEVDNFKSIVLRGGHNDRENPFIKDELVRRLYVDMGNVSSRGTHGNLFMNGEYRGYYNPCEHIKEEFCQEWYNSDKPWDVMTMSGIRDGEWNSWNYMTNYARSHNLTNSVYYNEVARVLDIPAFADYLILQLWNGNWDWPQNNWAAAAERSSEGKWRFFIWDAEGAFFSDRLYTVYFDRVNSQDNANGWLYRSLKPSPEFRQVFADRLFKHFYNGGSLTAGHIYNRFQDLRMELSGVIGGMDSYLLDVWEPQRLNIFFNACDSEGLWTFVGPAFYVNGTYQQGGEVSAGSSMSMSNPSGSGTIYYTLDGSDPRTTGGSQPGTSITLAAESSGKRVFVPTAPVDENWKGGAFFDDSEWIYTSGAPGGVGYERTGGYEDLISLNVHDNMYGIAKGCYIRIPFTFNGDVSEIEELVLDIRYDDAFVAYLNGDEIERGNYEGEALWDSGPLTGREAGVPERFDVSDHINKVRVGENILAIHGMNVTTASSDFLVTASLTAVTNGGGGTPSGRFEYSGPVALNRTSEVKARVLQGATWSGLNETVFSVGPVAANLRISELMYHPYEPNDANDPNEEYVELTNVGGTALNLKLVRFTNGIDFTFGSVSLGPGERVVVVEDREAFEAEYGTGIRIAGEYDGKLDNGGERIRLEDAIGRTVQDFKYDDDWREITDGGGYSLTVIDAGNSDANSWWQKDSWRASVYEGGSPGSDDSGILPNPGAVVFNKILAHSHDYAPDWIELYNTTGEDIDIGGWYISDSNSDLRKYEIAAGTTLKTGEYLVLYEDVNFGDSRWDSGCHTAFAFSENGDSVYLTSASGGVLLGYREHEDFGASETGVPFGRYFKGSTGNYNFVSMDSNTPGEGNSYPQVGPIVISEIMYHPDWPKTSGSYTNDQYEYIELHNISDEAVTLYDFEEEEPWKFTDGVEFTFLDYPPATIPADGYLVLARHPEAFSFRYPEVPADQIVGPYTGGLDDAGEKVELSKPGDRDEFHVRYYIRVDRVSYSDGSHPGDCPSDVDLWPGGADGGGMTLTRISAESYGNDPNNWTAASPSPGQ